MGVLKPNLKEGKGVPEQEIRENIFVYATKTYFRHFIELLGLNVFYFILSIVPLIISWFVTSEFFWWRNLLPMPAELDVTQFAIQFYPRVIFAILCIFIPVIQFGPIQCGASYVVRNISRRTHTYVWQDFWEHTKSNFKQSLIISVINILATVLLGFAIFYWSSEYAPIQGFVANVITVFLSFVFILFMSMSQYIYSLIVSYNMNIKELYVASYQLALKRLWLNVLFILIVVAILILLASLHFAVLVGAIMLILPVTILFANVYMVDSAIRKFGNVKE